MNNMDLEWGSSPSWADIEEHEGDMTGIKVFETEPDENGVRHKTVVEYSINEEGKTVKTTKRYKIYTKKVRINKVVEARKKNWRKFGDAKDGEIGVTIPGEYVELELTSRKKQDRALEALQAALEKDDKAETWTSRARRLGADSWDDITQKDENNNNNNGNETSEGIYVPRGLRRGGERSDEATLRVTNLSEETQEDDLRELFRKFGRIQRVYLAKDRVSGRARGFAFVNFENRDDAAKAIEALSGFGYDHLILNVEWARPSKPY